MEEWTEDVQQQVVELFKEYHHIFALFDLELGCTTKIKHEIKLDNEALFKDHYHHIPTTPIQRGMEKFAGYVGHRCH